MLTKVNLNRIAGYRVCLGMTQRDIAEYMNISPQSYSNKENGLRQFNDKEKIKLKELFQKIDANLTIDQIFFDDKVNNSYK